MKEIQRFEPVTRAELPARAARLATEGWRLVQILFTPLPDRFELLYSFDRDYELLSLRVDLPRADAVVPSITTAYFAAVTYENEMQDLAGIKVTGLPLDYLGDFYRKTKPAPFGAPQDPAGCAVAPQRVNGGVPRGGA